ncbi:MAG TPA: TAL effector repeat-containing protein [Burkholderiaceae bacterium]|nr:TAL effector repeat-containing protein [Burkholderiaceae bacterium]
MALAAVKEHLQKLRAESYGLTTGQVVAIASNGEPEQAS